MRLYSAVVCAPLVVVGEYVVRLLQPLECAGVGAAATGGIGAEASWRAELRSAAPLVDLATVVLGQRAAAPDAVPGSWDPCSRARVERPAAQDISP